MGFKDNEGETIFHPSAQVELLNEDDERSAPPLPAPTVVMPVPLVSTPIVHRELSCLDTSKGASPDDIQPQMGRHYGHVSRHSPVVSVGSAVEISTSENTSHYSVPSPNPF